MTFNSKHEVTLSLWLDHKINLDLWPWKKLMMDLKFDCGMTLTLNLTLVALNWIFSDVSSASDAWECILVLWSALGDCDYFQLLTLLCSFYFLV